MRKNVEKRVPLGKSKIRKKPSIEKESQSSITDSPRRRKGGLK